MKRERRFIAVHIPEETLCELIRPGGGEIVAWVEGLPKTAEIERVTYREDSLSLVAIFYDESFEVVPPGCMIPFGSMCCELRKFPRTEESSNRR